MRKEIISIKIITLMFTVLVSVSFLNTLGMQVNAQQETVISVFEAVSGDSTITVGEEGVPVNTTNPTPPFTVNITVSNVNDLFAWGILLTYDNTILNCMEDWAWLPEDHVFSYLSAEDFTELGPFVEYDGFQDSWVVHYGVTLMGEDLSLFSGSGTLCQINFTGIAVGTSPLILPSGDVRVDLKTLDPESPTGLASIEFSVSDGTVEVIPEFPTLAITSLLIILTLVVVIISKVASSKKARGPIVTR